MRNKVPPPIVMLVFAAFAYGSDDFLPAATMLYAREMGSAIIGAGFAIAIVAAMSFRKAKTTVNPLKPDTATSLVIAGVFKYTRNPMYLGLMLVLNGLCLHINPLSVLIFCPLFILYMNKFQIEPEEEAMEKLFGQEFLDYKKAVRRWI